MQDLLYQKAMAHLKKLWQPHFCISNLITYIKQLGDL